MSQLLDWFSNLEPAEKSSAMAIIDDCSFLHFYIDLMRNEHQQQQSSYGYSHALFMKDYLSTLFEKARIHRKSISKWDESRGYQKSFDIDLAEAKILGTDTVLLSFLNVGQTVGIDKSDFSDPFLLSLHHSTSSISSSSRSSKGCDSSLSSKGGRGDSSSLSASVESISYPIEESIGSRTARNGASLFDIKLGLQSAVSSLFNTAVLNVANKLDSQHTNHPRSSNCKISSSTVSDGLEGGMEIQLDRQIIKEPGKDHFEIAMELNRSIAISFATSGTGTFDCLFLMRPITEDSSKLLEIFRILSNGLMFSDSPSPAEVKAVISGKVLPYTGWLSNMLTVGSKAGVSSVPVPYYMMLLSRIELSIWSAYFSSLGRVKSFSDPTPSWDSDVPEGSYQSILLLPRSNRHMKAKTSNLEQTPIRNSLRVLERSSLYSLASSSVMLTLGCIIEEYKQLWRVLHKGENLKILNLFPVAKAFYSDSRNSRGRPEGIVDRLVLCPLSWIVETEGAELDARRAFNYLEMVAQGANCDDSNDSSSSGSGCAKVSSSDSVSAERLNCGPPISGISETFLDTARPGLIRFNECTKRTGAMQSSTFSAVEEGVGNSPALRGANTRSAVIPLGLSKRNVTHLTTEQVAKELKQPQPPPLCKLLNSAVMKTSVSFGIEIEIERNDEEIKEKHRLKKMMINKEVELDRKVKEQKVLSPTISTSPLIPTADITATEIIFTKNTNDPASKSKKNKKKSKSTALTTEKEDLSIDTLRVEVSMESESKHCDTVLAKENCLLRSQDIGQMCDHWAESSETRTGTFMSVANTKLPPTDAVDAADTSALPIVLADKSAPFLLPPLLLHEHRSPTTSEPDTHFMTEQQEKPAAYSNANDPSELERRNNDSDESFQLVQSKSRRLSSKQLKQHTLSNLPSNPDISQLMPRNTIALSGGDKVALPVPSEIKGSNDIIEMLKIRNDTSVTTDATESILPLEITFGSFFTGAKPTDLIQMTSECSGNQLDTLSNAHDSICNISKPSGAFISAVPLSLSLPSTTTMIAGTPTNRAGQASGECFRSPQSSFLRDDKLPPRRTHPDDERLPPSSSNMLFPSEEHTTSGQKNRKAVSQTDVAESQALTGYEVRSRNGSGKYIYNSSPSYEDTSSVTYYPSSDPNYSHPSDPRSNTTRHAVSMRRSAPYREVGSGNGGGRGSKELIEWKTKATSLRIQKTLTKNIRSFSNVSRLFSS